MHKDLDLAGVWREDLRGSADTSAARMPLVDFAATVWSQKGLVATVFLLCTALGLFFAARQSTYYYAHALLALGGGQSVRLVEQDGAPKDDLIRINTEVETLGSTAIMSRIVDKLGPLSVASAIGLESPDYFVDLEAPYLRQTKSDWKAGFGGAAGAPADASSEAGLPRLDPGSPNLVQPGSVSAPGEAARNNAVTARYDRLAPKSRREHLIRELQEHVTVRRRSQSDVIEVGFTSPQADGAVKLSAAIVSAYLDSKADERRDAAQRASEWLDAQVQQLGQEIRLKEGKISEFEIQNQLLLVEGSTLAETQYKSLQEEVTAARTDLIAKTSLQSQMHSAQQSSVSRDTLLEIVNSPTVQRLRDRESELATKLADARPRLGEQHPEMIANKSELQEVRQHLSTEIERVRASIDNDVKVAQTRLGNLEEKLAALEGRIISGKRADVSLQAMQRESESSAAMLENLMTTAREVAQRETLKVVDARVVSSPILPTKPSSPMPLLWVSLFTILGAVLGLASALVRSALRDTIVRPETIGSALGVSALISVPKLSNRQMIYKDDARRGPQGYVVNKPLSAFTENFRVLLSYIRTSNQGINPIIAITSAEASEGKTTTSLCLARTAAMSGLKVLLVDGDLRRPSLSRLLRRQQEITSTPDDVSDVGFRSPLNLMRDDRTPLEIMLVEPDKSGEYTPLIDPQNLCAQIVSMRSQYDLIIIDCAPILAIAETRLFCSIADGTLMVCRWNATRTAVMKTAKREIERSNGQLFGVVLNLVKTGTISHFSHSDVLNYGRGGKGYYEGPN